MRHFCHAISISKENLDFCEMTNVVLKVFFNFFKR